MNTSVIEKASGADQAGAEQTRRQVGRRLRVLRVQSRYRTTADLAEAIEARFGVCVDARHLYALEMGRAKAEIELWWMLSEIYMVGIHDLLGKANPIARPRNPGFTVPRRDRNISGRAAIAREFFRR